MNKERKLIIAGNWKMNKTVAEALDLVRDLKLDLANVKEVDIVVCPPFTALELGVQGHPRFQHPARRAEHERAQRRRVHRRDRRRDAQGIFRALRHPRPLRAAPVPEGIRRADCQESRGGRTPPRSSRLSAWAKRWPNARRARWKKFWKPRCAAASPG